MEVVHRLLNYPSLQIIQRKDMFNFSLDTVMLSFFVTINKDVKRILDIGTNNAAIPLLLSTRCDKPIIGLEIQKEAIDLAQKNIVLNHLEDQITVVHEAVQTYSLGNNEKKFGLIVCNPPFFDLNQHQQTKQNPMIMMARHEITLNLKELIEHASRLLENQGRFAMIHRPDRFIEIMDMMMSYDIMPKRIRFIHPKESKRAHMLMIEGIYKGKRGGFIVEPPLIAHNEDGSYSDEVMSYFGGEINE